VFSANRFCSVALRTPPRAVRVQLEDELNPRKGYLLPACADT